MASDEIQKVRSITISQRNIREMHERIYEFLMGKKWRVSFIPLDVEYIPIIPEEKIRVLDVVYSDLYPDEHFCGEIEIQLGEQLEMQEYPQSGAILITVPFGNPSSSDLSRYSSVGFGTESLVLVDQKIIRYVFSSPVPTS